MIVVRVELWSAISGEKTEIARMHISNDGRTSRGNPRRGDYYGVTFIGRSAEALNRQKVSKTGHVGNYPRQELHVWNLVSAMLNKMGYVR